MEQRPGIRKSAAVLILIVMKNVRFIFILPLERRGLAKKPIVEIDCLEVWRQISGYLDNEVEPDLRAAMSAHFKECAHCSAILDGTRNVVKLVGDGKAFELPAGTGRRLYAKLDDHLAGKAPKGTKKRASKPN